MFSSKLYKNCVNDVEIEDISNKIEDKEVDENAKKFLDENDNINDDEVDNNDDDEYLNDSTVKIVDNSVSENSAVAHNVDEVDDIEAEKNQDIELVEMDLELQKPLDIKDAVQLLRSRPEQLFFVFIDHRCNKRVIFKRKDSTIGLY